MLGARLRALLAIDVARELAAIDVPVLWLTAAHDRLVPAGATAHVRALRPDFEFRRLDGPHLLLQRRPIESAAVVSEFLARATARAV